MKRYAKVLMCVVLAAALFVAFSFNALASASILTVDFNALNPPDVTVAQYQGEGVNYSYAYSFNYSNKCLESFDYNSYGFGRSMPFVFEPFYVMASPYDVSGHAFSYKYFGDEFDSSGLLDSGYYMTGLKFCFVFGLQDLSMDVDVSLVDVSFSLMDGSIEPTPYKKVVNTKYLGSVDITTTDGDIPFNLYLSEVSLTYEAVPIESSSYFTNPRVEFNYSWSGLPKYYTRVFSGISRIQLEYIDSSNLESYGQSIQVDKNNQVISGIQNDLNNASNDLAVDKPSDEAVDNVLNDIDIGKVEVFENIGGVNSLSSDSSIKQLLSLLCVSCLGIAFIGYVLHGKRG